MIVPPVAPTTDQHQTNLQQQEEQRQQQDQLQVQIDETGPRASPASEPARAASPAAAADDDDNSCYLADDDATVDLGKPEHQEIAELQLKSQQQQVVAAAASTKRRSSWRHLLSPSYKSRSDEFHKCFASEIPKGERLIADYSCALHREFLIQGRLYVSVNYLAFYSNLFSWITKLVVRLRDIRDIHKANTAKIIPNAIQILTQTNEKHVFASFIARDKSFLLIWRIWRNNNQLKERLSDQEIRRLVHLSYGKDLGLNDQEESKFTFQPLPRTPANYIDELTSDPQHQQVVLDRNNNSAVPAKQRGAAAGAAAKRSRFKSRSQSQKELIMFMSSAGAGAGGDEDATTALKQRGHTRYSSVDCGRLQSQQVSMAPAASQVDLMLSELSGKLAELSSARGPAVAGETNCSPASSAVVVDTPTELKGRRSRESHGSPEAAEADNRAPPVGQIFAPTVAAAAERRAPNLVEAQQRVGTGSSGDAGTTIVELECSPVVASVENENGDQKQQMPAIEASEQQQVEQAANLVEKPNTNEQEQQQQQQQKQQEEEQMGPPLNTKCDCDAHEGELLVDEELDINVDILFSLIFTNSKFMRAHMLQRGQEDLVVGKWRRPSGGGGGGANGPAQSDRSNSSTLSSRGGGGGVSVCGESGGDHGHRGRRGSTASSQHRAQARKNFKTKQVRTLNYSMNVNHVLARQVQVEEKQNICQVRPGVYVLESQTQNSGFPCSESFTIDLKYCLTRTSHLNKSRLRVHGQINFLKEKQSWRLAMVKPIIEKQSMQGIVDFLTDLIVSIRKHIELKKQQADPTVYLEPGEAAATTTTTTTATHNNISAQSGDDQPPTAHHQQLVGGTAAKHPSHHHQHHHHNHHHHNHHHQQHSRSSLARAKSKLKERKLRNMYKYYIHSRSHRAADSSSGEGDPRSPGGATGSIASSASSSSSSLSSSLCGANLNDDDESMIMMLASGGRAKNDRQNYLGGGGGGHLSTGRNHQSERHHDHLAHDDDDDDDTATDDETGDEYDNDTRANFQVGRRSFSDLEDGPMQQQQQRFNGNQSDDQDDEWPRRRRHLESETSNATLNNEQPARAPPSQRLFGGWIGSSSSGTHRESQRRRSSAQSASHNPTVPSHNSRTKQARPSQTGRSRPIAATAQFACDADKQHQTGGGAPPTTGARLLSRLLTTRNLVSLVLVGLVLLVLAMIMSHAVILRRLGHVEQLLRANCNSSRQPPPPTTYLGPPIL